MNVYLKTDTFQLSPSDTPSPKKRENLRTLPHTYKKAPNTRSPAIRFVTLLSALREEEEEDATTFSRILRFRLLGTGAAGITIGTPLCDIEFELVPLSPLNSFMENMGEKH